MRLAILGLAMLSVACGGPELGDLVSQELTLSVRAVSSDPEVTAIGEPRGGIGVNRANLRTSALSLLPCNEQVAPLILDPREYELVHEPPFSERVTTAVNEFCGLRIDIEPLDENTVDDVPKGASLHVEGTDAEGEPFTLTSEGSFSLLLETEDDIGFSKLPLLLGLDAAIWLSGLPLPEDSATMGTELLEEQLPASLALYVDADEDGALDEDETTPIARVETP